MTQTKINPATKNVTNRKQTQIIDHIHIPKPPTKPTKDYHLPPHTHSSIAIKNQAPINIRSPKTMKATLNPKTHIGKPPNNQQKEKEIDPLPSSTHEIENQKSLARRETKATAPREETER
jgi:hypothetical protein